MGPPVGNPPGKGFWLCTSDRLVITEEAPTYDDAAATVEILSRTLPRPTHCEAHSENTPGAAKIRAFLREAQRPISHHPLLGRTVQGTLFIPGEYSPHEITTATRRVQDAPLLKDPQRTAFHHQGHIYFSYTTASGETRYQRASAQGMVAGRYELSPDGDELFEMMIGDIWQGPRPFPPDRTAHKAPDGRLIFDRVAATNPSFPDAAQPLEGTHCITERDFLTAFHTATYVDDFAIYRRRQAEAALDELDRAPPNRRNYY